MSGSLFEHWIGVGPWNKINVRQEDIVCLGKLQGDVPQIIDGIEVLPRKFDLVRLIIKTLTDVYTYAFLVH